MKAPQIKDNLNRKNFLVQEEKQRSLKLLKINPKTQCNWWARHKLSAFSHQSHKNRCIFTSRSASTSRNFKLSRLEFRRWALKSYLPGLGKGSW